MWLEAKYKMNIIFDSFDNENFKYDPGTINPEKTGISNYYAYLWKK